jgi:hypothetical protein
VREHLDVVLLVPHTRDDCGTVYDTVPLQPNPLYLVSLWSGSPCNSPIRGTARGKSGRHSVVQFVMKAKVANAHFFPRAVH